MSIYTFHLAEIPPPVTVRALARPPSSRTVPGLGHAECLAMMRLGAPTVSPDRLQLRRLAVFAQWRDEAAVESFLADDALGRHLAEGWHVRLEFLRRWSSLKALPDLPVRAGDWTQDEPVVAVTVARMRTPRGASVPALGQAGGAAGPRPSRRHPRPRRLPAAADDLDLLRLALGA